MPAFTNIIFGIHKKCGGYVRKATQNLGVKAIYYCTSCWKNSAIGNLSPDHDVYRWLDIDILDTPQTNKLGLAFPTQNTDNYQFVHDTGFSYVRIDCDWDYREPSNGEFNWTPLDNRIIEGNRLGFKWILTLICNSSWGTTTVPGTTSLNQPPTDVADWTNFVMRTVARYSLGNQYTMPGLTKNVNLYMFPNEWNSTSNKYGGWGGTYTDLHDLMNTTYDAIKYANPDATFIIGASGTAHTSALAVYAGYGDYDVITSAGTFSPTDISSSYAAEYTDTTNFYKNLKGDYIDCHFYGPIAHDNPKISLMTELKGYATSSPQLCTTEFGGPSTYYDSDMKDIEFFMNPIERYLNYINKGFAFQTWFGLVTTSETSTNRFVPLMENKDKIRPQYYATKLLANLFKDGVMSVTHITDSLYFILVSPFYGKYVAWKAGSDTTFAAQLYTHTANDYILVYDPKNGKYAEKVLPDDGIVTLTDLPSIFTYDFTA